jgi:hypothetical protein
MNRLRNEGSKQAPQIKQTRISKMKTLKTISAAIILSATSFAVNAGTLGEMNIFNSERLINQVQLAPELLQFKSVCYGCISGSTGRPRTNYVQPHFRSNGAYVQGYWRS